MAQRVVRGDELRIGLAEEFDKKARQPVAGQKKAGHQAGGFQRAPAQGHEQHQPEQQPFQAGLVQLAGVAGARPRRDSGAILSGIAGKDHRPGQIGGPPPEFGIDEIGDPAEEKPDGGDQRHRIGKLQRRHPVASAKPQAREDHPQKTAVKRHAAFPDLENVAGMGKVMIGPVEQHEAEPAADDHPEDDRGQQILDPFRIHRRGAAGPEVRSAHQRHDDPPAGDQPDKIGHRVPAQRDVKTEDRKREDFVRDVGKRHDGLHGCFSGAPKTVGSR